jgi:hypothetical protein
MAFAISIYLFVRSQTARGHHMSWILTSKSGDIDRPNLPGITPVAPCVGGLIIWYAKLRTIARETTGQQEQTAPATKAQTPGK